MCNWCPALSSTFIKGWRDGRDAVQIESKRKADGNKRGAEAAKRKSAVCRERNRLEGTSNGNVGAGGRRAGSKLSAKNGESECLLPGADGSWLSHHSLLCYEQFEPLQSDPSITDQLSG